MKNINRKAETLTEQALKESELRYRRLFETTQDGILILNAETGMIDDVNPYLIEMLGYSREEFIKKKLWEVGAFKDIDASQMAFETLQENEYIRYEDLPLRAKDAQLIQVEFVSNLYLVNDKKVIQCNIRNVTEHKRIVAALQENEKTYYELINQSRDGFFVIASSGKILTVNKAICQALKYSPEALLCMNIWDIIPEQYLDQHRKRLKKILSGKSLSEEAEYIVQGKDGQTHYVEIISAPHYSGKDIVGFQGIARDITVRKQAEQKLDDLSKFPSENPNPVLRVNSDGIVLYANAPSGAILDMWGCALGGAIPQLWRDLVAQTLASMKIKTIDVECDAKVYSLVVTPLAGAEYATIYGHDITDRKQAEDALQGSKLITEGIINTIPVRVFWKDKNLVYLGCNALFACDAGFTDPKEIIGKDDDQLAWRAQSGSYRKDDRQVIESGRSKLIIEGPQTTPEGDTITLLTSKAPLRNLKGDVIGVIGTYTDITEYKQAQAARLESERRFRDMQENIDLIAVMLDRDGRVTFCNDYLLDLTGHSRESVLGQDWFELLLPPESNIKDDFLAGIQQDTVIGTHYENEILTSSGERRLIAWNNIILKDDKGHTIGTNSIGEDITQRKQAEIEIRQRLSELEVLYQSGLAFSQMLTPKVIAKKIIDLLDQKMDWHHTAIRLYHPESETLELLAFHLPNLHSLEERDAAKEQLKSMEGVGKGLSGWVYHHSQVVRSNDLQNDPRYFDTFPDLKSGLYVPIKNAERVIGVISIESKRSDAFSESDERLAITLAGQAGIAIENARLFEDAQHSNAELALAYETTLEGWSHALDLRDKETEGHTQRVTEMTVNLARAFGLSETELVDVRRGALLHDIGKMGVPDHILLKPGKLTEDEWNQMRMHPVYAYDLLSPITYLRNALNIPHYHHEKWDGSGYPDGLKGEQIPLAARIFAVVDVWDALTSDRPYRPAWTREKAREHIYTSSGTHFDPQVVDKFLQIRGTISEI